MNNDKLARIANFDGLFEVISETKIVVDEHHVRFTDLNDDTFDVYDDGRIIKNEQLKTDGSSDFHKSNGYKYPGSIFIKTPYGDARRKMIGAHTIVGMCFLQEDYEDHMMNWERTSKMFCVNHKDNNAYNNSVDNLEWVTDSLNHLHGAHCAYLLESAMSFNKVEDFFFKTIRTDSKGNLVEKWVLKEGISAYDLPEKKYIDALVLSRKVGENNV